MCHNLFDSLEEFNLMYKIDLDELISKLEKEIK